jgi:hypothetical protein
VHVGDGAEGLVAHAMSLRSGEALMLIYAPTRVIGALRVGQALAERTAGSAIAPVPLQQPRVVLVGRAAEESSRSPS